MVLYPDVRHLWVHLLIPVAVLVSTGNLHQRHLVLLQKPSLLERDHMVGAEQGCMAPAHVLRLLRVKLVLPSTALSQTLVRSRRHIVGRLVRVVAEAGVAGDHARTSDRSEFTGRVISVYSQT